MTNIMTELLHTSLSQACNIADILTLPLTRILLAVSSFRFRYWSLPGKRGRCRCSDAGSTIGSHCLNRPRTPMCSAVVRQAYYRSFHDHVGIIESFYRTGMAACLTNGHYTPILYSMAKLRDLFTKCKKLKTLKETRILHYLTLNESERKICKYKVCSENLDSRDIVFNKYFKKSRKWESI